MLYFENDAIQGQKITILKKKYINMIDAVLYKKISKFCMCRNIIKLDGVAYE